MLRITPSLGRAFAPEEDARGAGVTSVVLSHDFWTEHLGGDPAALGEPVVLNGLPWTVVGVLPAGATLAPHYREPVDVWFPLGAAALIDGPPVYPNRGYRIFQLIGRLRPGATEADLARDVERMSVDLEREHPETSTGWRWIATDLRTQVLRGVEGPIASLLVGGLVLFAVAVVNLLALFVQSLRRDLTELATRRALGARVRDLVRLGLLELAFLGAAGGVAGVTVAVVGVGLLPHWLGLTLPAHAEVGFDALLAVASFFVAEVLVLAVGIAVMTHTLRGLATSAVVGGRVVGSSRTGSRATSASLGVQVALTTVLAVGSAVAARSFLALGSMDPGIHPEGLTALRVDVPPESRSDEELPVTTREILDALASVPGVEAAHLWSPHVPTAATWFTRVRLLDRPDLRDAELPAVRINSVSPGAVRGIGLELVAGRDIAAEDRDSGRGVVLVSRSAAIAWWGGAEQAVGRSIRRWNHERWSEVIGVVEDAPLSGRRGEGSDFFTDVYFLFEQDLQRGLVFLTRAGAGERVEAGDLREAVRQSAVDLPAYDVRTMSDRLAEQDALGRSAALLGVVFATTSIVLAALGLYGAVATIAARRRRELGLRQALGASPARLVSELVGGPSGVVIVGLLAGIFVARYALTPLDPTLFLVGPRDLPSYAIGVAAIATAAALALAIPAVRAVRSPPAATLRDA